MPSKSARADLLPAHSVLSDHRVPSAEAIRLQLSAVLASAHFRNSKRCQALLKHVVEAYLTGCLDKVKERCIGFEVFQRDPGYDTSQDSIVRTTAAEVRKRLAQYYLEPEHEDELRIVLPPGSYSPEFHLPSPVGVLPQSSIYRGRISFRLCLVAAILVVIAATSLYARFRINNFDRFWMPLVRDSSDVVICIEQPIRIFRFTGPRSQQLNEKLIGSTPQIPASASPDLGNSSIGLSEVRPIGGNYFSYGDLMATARISELLGRKGKTFQILGDRLTKYRDLRGRPAILLGEFNNKWTLGLMSGLRYYLNKDAASHRYEVRDRQKPNRILASIPQSNRPEEYAIVSRILDVATEKTVIVVVGTTFFGTLAGGDFLTHASYIEDAFRGAPAKWYRKNIQVVLKATVVDGAPGPPKVVLTYFW